MKTAHKLANIALWMVEGCVLLLLTVAFWHLPAIRQDWIWLLAAALPIFWLRRVVRGYVLPPSPLNGLLVAFWLLTLWNFFGDSTPFRRASYLEVMSRPLLGIWLVVYLIDLVHSTRRQLSVVLPTLGIATVLGLIAITATGWLPDKEPFLAPLMAAMPIVNYRDVVPDMLLGFNPNEIAGALAWLTPLCFTLAIGQRNKISLGWLLVRIWALCAFGLLFVALFLGQSRFGLAGVLLAMFFAGGLVLTRWPWKVVAFACIGFVIALQGALFLNVFTATDDASVVSSRDERSVTQRIAIWDRAVRMISDNPTTGVGMSAYRTAASTDEYAIPDDDGSPRFVPHAHNALLQIGTDLGLGGMVLYIALHGVVIWMLWSAAHGPAPDLRIIAIAVAAGWLAHSVYSVGDTVALWDRFAFLFWWMLGLAGAIHQLNAKQTSM